ncbi:hypothetical protein TNCV_4358851 [Trichonephila clavipes]|nr:hypothetical protein TNCV_4358851 [Trichonephila clavipes]
MLDKSRKEISSSKKSANGPDKISVYDSDVKGPSKYIGPIKCLASRTGIHPASKLRSKNLDLHPVCLIRNFKNRNDVPGLRALVPASGLDVKDMHRTDAIPIRCSTNVPRTGLSDTADGRCHWDAALRMARECVAFLKLCGRDTCHSVAYTVDKHCCSLTVIDLLSPAG